MQATWIRSLGWEDPLKKEKATHSSILAWRILRTIESTQRVRHDWETFTSPLPPPGGEVTAENRERTCLRIVTPSPSVLRPAPPLLRPALVSGRAGPGRSAPFFVFPCLLGLLFSVPAFHGLQGASRLWRMQADSFGECPSVWV